MRARWLFACWVSMLGLAAAAAPTVFGPSTAEGDAPALDAYAGTWRYADGARGRGDIERAVARSVSGLPFFAEPIAANQVRQMTGPFERVTFSVRNDRVVFRADHWGPVGARVNGPAERIPGPDGTPLMLTHALDDGRLVQLFQHPDGSRRNVFALSGDQRWLWMSVRIHSPRLPDDCVYRLRYQRMDVPPSQLAGR